MSLLLGFFCFSMLAWNCQILANVSAADLFSKVRCDTDIPKALIGGLMSNEKDVTVEARHKALGLKDLGGSEMTGGFIPVIMAHLRKRIPVDLDKKSIVRDVLQFPQHSKASPEFIGSCR
jgi:hypothetical protein